jgi:hypothetical protein
MELYIHHQTLKSKAQSIGIQPDPQYALSYA